MPFSALHLPAPLLKAVHELGYTAPTRIQAQAIPLILAGKDIIGQSQTGSGKTAAFGLPMLAKIVPGRLQGLILTPTRELCIQVSDALRGFAKHTRLRITPVFGGVGIGPQIQAARFAEVIVATPGRLLDLMERGLRLSTVTYLVLDEADRMLDMGFIDDVERIIRQIPKQRQTLLFSATLSPRLQSLVHKHMHAPVTIQTELRVDTSLLTERAYPVEMSDKLSLLAHLLKHETPGVAIVFCRTRHGCDKVAKRLRAQHIDATAIHGGLAQNKRTRVIESLHQSKLGVLVATDVASRGLHIENISHVYNYDIPGTPDDYVHRIGRTARAGAKGDAVTFVSPQEAHDFKNILRTVKREVLFSPLPKFERIVLPPSQFVHGKPSHHPQGGKHRKFWKRH
ncbi:DEAD/DEAH box helicase [Candidatus Woesearchaeota archaeon]|nr:DEAD/DEAH box helicase [Candidatus Woesearchaeota archaeon]